MIGEISDLPFGLGFEVPLKLFEIVPYVVVVEVESVDIFSFLSVPTFALEYYRVRVLFNPFTE